MNTLAKDRLEQLSNIGFIGGFGSMSPKKIFFGYFEGLPSTIEIEEVDTSALQTEFRQEFGKQVQEYHFARRYSKDGKEEEVSVFLMKQEVLVYVDDEDVSLYFHGERIDEVQDILRFVKGFRKKKPEAGEINLIISEQGKFGNQRIPFRKLDLNLGQCYNSGFPAFHDKIVACLKEEKRSGLHLLYGPPGTGKSTYLRHLCGHVEKKMVFLPGQMAKSLDTVHMTQYLLQNPNSVLIIEDAEELLVSREQQRNSNISMILNLTDGLLGESLGIQIIATFNTHLKNIDPALKRKGRLKTSYEFGPLSTEKSNLLLKEQGVELKVSRPHTLAEIYNFEKEEGYREPERAAMGFRV